MPRHVVRFLRRGRIAERSGFAPAETLLGHLRLHERALGAKEGCAEGDCGACTVAIGRLRNGRVAYEPVNACIQLLGAVDGTEVVTADDLAEPGGRLHPVQRALVDAHASQCGFCTPGFVMSLFTLYHAGVRADRGTVNDWLAGNLCRCTGYRPIVDAALACCSGEPDDAYAKRASETARRLAALADGEDDLFAGSEDAFFAAPATEDGLAAAAARFPDAAIVAGATDVGLRITKQLRELPRILHTGRVASLHEVREEDDRVEIGAAATYAEAEPALRALDPDVGEMLRRLGSKQVRAVGTVGGNVANGSPVGDSPPVLIALGAAIELRHRDARRTLPLEDFFLDYGRQDRAPGEILTRIVVPRPGPAEHFRCYKISKRYDQDVSALLGAFRLRIERGRVVEARIAYGGMAATPKRARNAERAIAGLRLDEPAAWTAATDALDRDFSPIDDHRASAAYRRRVARSLLAKALAEVAGRPSSETRVAGARERAAA